MNDSLYPFAVIVESKSLNQAASKLNISQPALSRKIMKLEEELGTTLFERKGKKLQLTRMGEMTYEYALEFIKLQRSLQQSIFNYQHLGKKTVTIGASLTTLQSTLPDIIHLLTQSEPDADIQAITGKTHEIIEYVETKRVDIGLVASKVEHEHIECFPLFDDHLSLVLPRQHVLSKKNNIEIEDLQHQPMILFSKGTWYRILMDEWFRTYNIFPEIKMEIDSFEGILRLVAICNAVTLLPQSYLRKSLLMDNKLEVKTINELTHMTRTTSMICSSYERLTPIAQRWLNKIIDHY